jgi:hypothetical protein
MCAKIDPRSLHIEDPLFDGIILEGPSKSISTTLLSGEIEILDRLVSRYGGSRSAMMRAGLRFFISEYIMSEGDHYTRDKLEDHIGFETFLGQRRRIRERGVGGESE